MVGSGSGSAPILVLTTDQAGILTHAAGTALAAPELTATVRVGRPILDALRGYDELTEAVRRALAGAEAAGRAVVAGAALQVRCLPVLSQGGAVGGIVLTATAAPREPVTPGRSPALLESIRRAQARLRAGGDAAAVFDRLLADLIALTDSAYGFIGEVIQPPGQSSCLQTLAISEIAWGETTRAFFQAHAVPGLQFHNLTNLIAAVIAGGRPVIANAPARDPRRGGIPEGHPRLTAFLGLPLFYGEELVGLVGIANRPGGYDDPVIQFLQPFLVACGGIIRDLRARNTRRRVEEERDRFFALSLDLLCVAGLDGRFRWINPAFTSTLGYAEDELLSRPFLEFVHPDDRKATAVELGKLARGISCRYFENRQRCKDGSLKWLVWSAVPVVEEGLFYAVARDATESKRVEQALRDSEERYRLAARATNDAIWDWDLRTDEVTWNGAVRDLFGYSRGQVGRTASWWIEQIHPEDRQRVLDGIRAVISGMREIWSDEYRFRRADGSYADVLDRGYVARDPSGRPIRMIGAVLDQTKRKRVESALKEADRHKDEFLAMLGHELRNPLAALSNGLNLLGLPGLDPAAAARARQVMGQQLHYLVHLVDDLLDVARIRHGKIPLHPATIDLAATVGHAVEAVRPLIEANRHTLAVTLPGEPVMLHADPTRLEQILTNLLSNAAKYTPPGGRIWLTAERDGGDAVLRVRDTGIGIAAEDLSRIFELFAQADPAHDSARGGLGLGLTLVRELVRMHGGRVSGASAGPGTGSEFVVRLPAPALAVAAPAPAPIPAPAPPAARPLRLLLVDDERDGVELLAEVLRCWGHEVRLAHEGHSAVLAARDGRPDVVLCDLGLPGLDGFEVARRIRAELGPAKPTLIALTGYGQEEHRHRSRDAGFDLHLTKPVDLDRLERFLISLVAPGSSRTPVPLAPHLGLIPAPPA